MIVSKTKRHLTRFDEMTLPTMEKMLPLEALVKKETPVINERKTFPRLAVASLAIVALVVATALVIGSVAGGNEKQIDPDNSLVLNNDSENTSMPSVLEGESFGEESPIDSSVSEKSDVPKNLPIVSCGKYTSAGTSSLVKVYPGEVVISTMGGGHVSKAELQDDVLYAVCFVASYLQSTEYKEGLERIEEEYESIDDPNFLEEYKKQDEFSKAIREAVTAKMYEYLEGLNIEFYDKTVYVIDSENGKVLSEDVYRIAFLTKEQIDSLKGGEDYGILVVQVFEEMAKMDNEPVYINEWASNS